MKIRQLLMPVLTALPLATCSPPTHLGACLSPSSLPFVPGQEASHREFPRPVITYPAGAALPRSFGFTAMLDITSDGRIACYRADGQSLNPQRREALKNLGKGRYTPFMLGGVGTAVRVVLPIDEQRAPSRHVPPPPEKPGSFAVTLKRGGCFGACPDYQVTIHDDGRAVYDGAANVLFAGHHEARVSAVDMDRLRRIAAQGDIWSADDRYAAAITDSAPNQLSVTQGDTTKTIDDYVGRDVGMPMAITEMEDLVDEVSGARSFIRGDATTADRLVAERYDFTSHEADQALTRLSGGAPLSLIAAFLDHGASPLAAMMGGVAAGRSDVFTLAAARMTAMDDGTLCELETRAAGSGNAGLFMTIAARVPKGCDGTAALAEVLGYHHDPVKSMSGEVCPGDGACFRPDRNAIARYLLDHGADPQAGSVFGGFVYTQVEDLKVRQLFLDKGFDLNRQTASGGYVLMDDQTEDEALFDLAHGADPAIGDSSNNSFAARAGSSGWWRVQFWLWRHGGHRA